MSFVIFTNKLPNNKKYFQFIIDNYHKTTGSKLIYTEEYFKVYLSKELTSFYELIFLEDTFTGEVLASIIVTKDNLQTKVRNKSFSYFYTNFACIRQDYRNKNITKLLLQDILSRFQTEFNLIYGITFEDNIKTGMNILKTFKLFNIYDKVFESKSEKLIELPEMDLNVFYNKKREIFDGISITNFPRKNKLYIYYKYDEDYIVLYKIKYKIDEKLIDMYYISDASNKIPEYIIIELIQKVCKNEDILNVPEHLLETPFKVITNFCIQNIKICNYISKDSLNSYFDINNVKIF